MNTDPTHNLDAKNVTVQTITQKAFDALVPAQQAFYRNLIEQGRAKIVPDGETIPPVPEKKKEGGNHKTERYLPPFDRLVGRQVKILLTNGQYVEGTLEEVSQFEGLLMTGTGTLVVFKGAIVTAEETKTPDQAAPPASGSM